MTAEIIARALGGRKVGAAWMARCPAHDDCEPSLSIHDVKDRVLVHCHAGCSQVRVIAVLRARGIWNHRASSAADTNARDCAIVCSIARQCGADIGVIRKALCRDGHGRASGSLGIALDRLADENRR